MVLREPYLAPEIDPEVAAGNTVLNITMYYLSGALTFSFRKPQEAWSRMLGILSLVPEFFIHQDSSHGSGLHLNNNPFSHYRLLDLSCPTNEGVGWGTLSLYTTGCYDGHFRLGQILCLGFFICKLGI